MERFVLSQESCTIGFQEHVSLNLLKPILPQLNRRRLYHRSGNDQGDDQAIKKIISHNSSLRIDLRWSFESTNMIKEVMSDCVNTVMPKYVSSVGNICTDTRCSWFGFVPFNTFERDAYEDLSTHSLVLFNNELIDFQLAVVEFIANHKIVRQHAIIRDDRYRFDLFKSMRKDPVDLSNAFEYYVDAVKSTSLLNAIPRDIVEESIGCHFLYYPEIFFELTEFYILKGDIYD